MISFWYLFDIFSCFCANAFVEDFRKALGKCFWSFGSHFDVVFGAFGGAVGTVKTVVLLRENIDFPHLGPSRGHIFFTTQFQRVSERVFDGFWVPGGSQFGSLLRFFGILIWGLILGRKVGGVGGTLGPPLA